MSKPANYVAKRIYFDWQQYESYREIAEFIGQDVVSLMAVCIDQGFKQIGEQLAQAATPCTHERTTNMLDGLGQVHTHCADCSANLTGANNAD